LKTQLPTVVLQLVMRSGQLVIEVHAYSQVGPALGSLAQISPVGQPDVPPSQGVSSAAFSVVVQAVARPLLLPPEEELEPEDEVPPVELLWLPDDPLEPEAPELVPAAAEQWPLTAQVWPVVQTEAVTVQLAMQVPVGPQTSAVPPVGLQAWS
jgi:hypothetical protein